MEPILEKASSGNMSLKRKLINTFFQNHYSSWKAEPIAKSQELMIAEEGQRMNRSSSSSVLMQPKILKSGPRPSSVCSSRSVRLLTEPFEDSSIPSDYLRAIKNITPQKVQFFKKNAKDENCLSLVFAFLILAAEVDSFEAKGKMMKNRVWPAFERITARPGAVIKIIRNLPKAIRNSKVSENCCKKASALFNVVDKKSLGTFSCLYAFLKETFNYINEVLNIQVTFEPQTAPSPVLVKRNKPRILKNKRNTSMQLNQSYGKHENPLAEKVFFISNLSKVRPASSLEVSKLFSNEPISISKQTLAQLPSPGKIFQDLINKPNLLNCSKNISDHCKQKVKAEKFLLDSRINRRIHEKLKKFCQEMITEGGKSSSWTDAAQKIIREFTHTLPCSEISSSSMRYIEHLLKTKEFERVIKKLID